MAKGKINELNTSRTQEERSLAASIAGKASGEARKEKASMRKLARTIADMGATGDAKAALAKLGLPENEQTNLAVVIAQLYAKAMNGDVMAIKMIQDLLGENFNQLMGMLEEDPNIVDIKWPEIHIPDNGRDKADDSIIQPQAGAQTQFLCTNADICIYGGAAGGGKTYAILLEGLRHRNVKNFGGVIFRKNHNQITAEGGLWDASHKIYDRIEGAEWKKTPSLHWEFSGGGRLGFAHLERDDDLSKWQGTEIAYLGFDELTHFTKHMFTYMLSRNRTTCGVRPYVRATCNPDADSWVADFISWWIDQDTGYAIKERSGQIRWMAMINDTFVWGDSPEEIASKYDVNPEDCKSVTFIASTLEDNKVLMESDPGYLANLKAMTEVDRERLLFGNWKIKASAGKYFQRQQIKVIEVIPNDIEFWCRGWDLAATAEDENTDADYTAGVLLGKRTNGNIVVLDVIHRRIKAGEVENLVLNTSLADKAKYGFNYMVRMAKDPGQAGKAQAENYVRLLSGFNIKVMQITGSKEVRATPFAAQWQNGNVEVLLGTWNDEYFSELESFPQSKHDDMVDASADAFSECASANFNIDNLL